MVATRAVERKREEKRERRRRRERKGKGGDRRKRQGERGKKREKKEKRDWGKGKGNMRGRPWFPSKPCPQWPEDLLSPMSLRFNHFPTAPP